MPSVGLPHPWWPWCVRALLNPGAIMAAFRLTYTESSSLCTSILSPQLCEIDLPGCTMILPSSHCYIASVSESTAVQGCVYVHSSQDLSCPLPCLPGAEARVSSPPGDNLILVRVGLVHSLMVWSDFLVDFGQVLFVLFIVLHILRQYLTA